MPAVRVRTTINYLFFDKRSPKVAYGGFAARVADEDKKQGDEDGPVSDVDMEEAQQREVSDEDPPTEPGGVGADAGERVPFVGWQHAPPA